MTALALALVLSAAFIHAGWNFLAKRAQGEMAFIWLFSALSTLIYAPIALGIVVIRQPLINDTGLLFIGGSVFLQLVYFLLLHKGYGEGDLSLVYPLARGTGPTLATIAAILLLGERPTPLALAGASLIVIGILVIIGGNPLPRKSLRRATAFGLLTGVAIAAYTIWDKHAVSVLLIPPLLLDYCATLGRVLVLAPHARRHWQEVRAEWRLHRWEALGVAGLSPLSYILVLTALIFTPVSYVAPAREVSIVIAALIGARFLNEGETTRRLTAGAVMTLGIVALAIG